MSQRPNVRVTCPGCQTAFIVMPPAIYKAVGDFAGVEGEVEFATRLATDVAQTGDRLTIGDLQGTYACPQCGTIGGVPPDVWGLSGDSAERTDG